MNKKMMRIIENIFDIMCDTQFKNEALKQLIKDISPHAVNVNKRAGIICIEDKNGNNLYIIDIKKAQRRCNDG